LLRAVTPESKLFVVARNLEKANEAKQHITAIPGSDILKENIIPMACDHTSLERVREFCTSLRGVLGRMKSKENNFGGIDILSLNAAVLLGEDAQAEFTKDDLEITFQTNHMAPFLIANLLFDLINPGGRVVTTSSGLHAFSKFEAFRGLADAKTGHVGKRFEMVNGEDFHHKKSYATSKLCNVAFSLALNRRLEEKNAKAICFTPGLIPSSGLFRHQKNWVNTMIKKQAINLDDTIEWGGCMLAWMILSERAIADASENEGVYWRAPYGISKRGGKIPNDIFLDPVNEDAISTANQEILWKLSTELAGDNLKHQPNVFPLRD
jgi:protochlorophyllide reductase